MHNVHFDLWFDSYISSTKKIMTKKTYMINHIPIKQVWVEGTIILIKDIQKWVHEKLLKNLLKKKCWFSITYQRIEVQNWVVQKMKGLQNLISYIKWDSNPYQYLQSMFSLVCSCFICSVCCMMNSVKMAPLHLNLNCICNKQGLCLVLHPVNTQKSPN